MATIPQPAKTSYFFDKGYKDLANTIRGAWKRNRASIAKYRGNLSTLAGKSLVPKIFLWIVNVLAMLAVLVCGSVITAVISAGNILVLLVFMLFVYIGFTVIWVVDRLYLVRKKIFSACPVCKKKSLIPTYICPGCGARHTNLTPGVYGILKRTCLCGEKLPTTFFNGRKELDAECPNPDCRARLSDRESRPVCIPVVGGRSVGKTAFITAFSREFIENVAPAHGIDTEFYDKKKEQIYGEITRDYDAGSTRMTARPTDVRLPSSVSFSFFAKHPTFKPDRLIHVYDIAGEVFTDHNENEVQQQYEYCHGIVLMIDPFSIPQVRFDYEELLEPEDVAGIGAADVNGVINAFLTKLREVTGLSDAKMATVPLAVVIGKTDSAGLDQDIGNRAVEKRMKAEPDKFTDYYDTMDYLCRQFLKDNGMESFLNSITVQFKNNRFFSCSAIGHTRDKGRYRPEGVLAPMEWLMSFADSQIAKVWNDRTFTKKPMAAMEKAPK